MPQLKLWEAERTRAGEAEERRQGKVAVIGVEVRKMIRIRISFKRSEPRKRKQRPEQRYNQKAETNRYQGDRRWKLKLKYWRITQGLRRSQGKR